MALTIDILFHVDDNTAPRQLARINFDIGLPRAEDRALSVRDAVRL
jgi:hypothetical protein